MADIEAERAWIAYFAERRLLVQPGERPQRVRPRNWRRRRYWSSAWPYYVVIGRRVLLH